MATTGEETAGKPRRTKAYKQVLVGGRQYYLHRLLWELEHGPIPIGHVVHHKDHDHRNNDLSNLELMTRAEHCVHHQDEVKHTPEYRASKVAAAAARKQVRYTCTHCGIAAIGIARKTTGRYCSDACQQGAYNTRRRIAQALEKAA